MDLKLTGKRAIITGGSVGIGKATARVLANEGVDILICARRQDILEQTASELAAETGRNIIPVVADTTSTESVNAMVARAVEELGGVDILVNNAAAPGGFVQGPLDESDDSDLLFDINTKVVGYFRCAKAVAPHMTAQGWGRIINVGGLAARNAGTFSGMRNLALAHLTKTLSIQLGPQGINVNLVHPGGTRTERTTEEAANAPQSNHIRKLVDATEIGYVVTFLASPKSTAIAGEVVAAGGGVGGAVYP